ncbi:hypothetical protein WME94_27295 [Sorangium sp. So ce429]
MWSLDPFLISLNPPAWETPDALVLFFSSEVQQCADPVIDMQIGVTCDIAPAWQFILMIPPELNKPGLIELSDIRIGFHKETMLLDCGGGGGMGTGHNGTLEIVSSDETSVVVKVRGVGDDHWPVDGDHTIPFCGD